MNYNKPKNLIKEYYFLIYYFFKSLLFFVLLLFFILTGIIILMIFMFPLLILRILKNNNIENYFNSEWDKICLLLFDKLSFYAFLTNKLYQHCFLRDSTFNDSIKIPFNYLVDQLSVLYWLREIELNENYYFEHPKVAINISVISKFEMIDKLILNNNFIKDLTPISKLINLKHLEINNTIVDSLVPLQNLINLEYLDCSFTPIQELGPIVNLLKLKFLNCNSTYIYEITPLFSLIQLEYLSCDINKEGYYPHRFYSYMKNVRNNIESNQIGINNITPISNLQKLRYLNISNTLAEDSTPLNNLVGLEKLICVASKFNSISSLAGLFELTYLDISKSNNIVDLFVFPENSKLTFLNINGTKISELTHLAHAKLLINLDVSNTPVHTLEPISNAFNLSKLICKRTSISNLMPLANLNKIEILDVSYTDINHLNGIESNKSLKSLYACSTYITDLSPLKNLIGLNQLDLGNNQIRNFDLLTGLINLTELKLYKTFLSDIYFIRPLVNLEKLDCASTKVSSVEALLYNVKLKEIKLDYTNVTSLPLDIFKRLKNLSNLSLIGCELQSVPREFYFSSNDTFYKLKDYIEDKRKYGEELNNEVKIILIGNGSVGKTQIAKRFSNPYNYVFDNVHDSTHGIVLLRRHLVCQDFERGLQISIWDFAGQDLYHATHRIFMQTRALFVLVWDELNESQTTHTYNGKIYNNENIQYWLSLATIFGGNSPILVLQNKIDTSYHKFSFAPPVIEEYKGHFPVYDFLKCSAKTGEGFNLLEHQISEIFLKNSILKDEILNIKLPKPWVKIIRELKKLHSQGVKSLNINHFKFICIKCGVASSSDTVLSFLHNAGIVYKKSDYFNNRIILDQSWAIKGIYKILDKDSKYYEIIKHQKGIVDFNLAKKIWEGQSDSEIFLFIGFMLSCEICFELSEGFLNDKDFINSKFVIPQLLPISAPDYIDDYINSIGMHYEIRLKYMFLPSAYFYRFLFKSHKLAKIQDIWQAGILIKYANEIVLIRAFFENNLIEIRSNLVNANLIVAVIKELELIIENDNIAPEYLNNSEVNLIQFGEEQLKKSLGFNDIEEYRSYSKPKLLNENVMGLKTTVILTALKEEYEAVREYLINVLKENINGTIYEHGLFQYNNKTICRVILRECGQSSENAAIDCERAMTNYSPDSIYFVGIAGSRKPQDYSIGDVIFPRKIYNYEGGRYTKTNFFARPETENMSYSLLELAKYESRQNNWRKFIKLKTDSTNIRASVGVIASGEKLVEHYNSGLGKLITNHYNDTQAVEMEGFGFSRAVNRRPADQMPLFGIVRGISDILENDSIKSDVNNLDRRPVNNKIFASSTAAAFAFWLIYKTYNA